MSSMLDGPWRCGSGGCWGRHEDCEAKLRNEFEPRWIERKVAEAAYENAWRESLGLPLITPTINDARDAWGDHLRAATAFTRNEARDGD